jgi:hypothetical protein
MGISKILAIVALLLFIVAILGIAGPFPLVPIGGCCLAVALLV